MFCSPHYLGHIFSLLLPTKTDAVNRSQSWEFWDSVSWFFKVVEKGNIGKQKNK